MEKLRTYISDARSAGNVQAVIVDGSYVTAKEEPGDIDILLVLKREIDLAQDIRPIEYRVQSKRMVKKLYGFDIFTAVEDSPTYRKLVDFFMGVNPGEPQKYTSRKKKGILRIEL